VSAIVFAALALPVGSVRAQGSVIEVVVDLAASRRTISPEIYGVSFADAEQLASLPYPSNRWGGNSVTRYNWRADISNRAADWFFMNISEPSLDPDLLPDGSTADQFVAESLDSGAVPLITVPLIGWTPVGVREKRWGFSVAKYGAQDRTECSATGGAFWCQPDAGNGLIGGAKITTADPTDTSMAIDASWVTDWLDHLGTGVRWFALDNEPMLWSETHFDVHPEPLTYDEIWDRTVNIAGAIKQDHPDAVTFGPVVWGWCAYFHSAADGCIAGADQAAHGDLPFLEWYLDQISQYQTSNGVRLVDVLDVHYYPQGGQALSAEGDAAMQSLRLRSVKDLYDPTYVSESWIGQPVELLPRLRRLVEDHCPGVEIAVTEYNWGRDDGITAALAQAEVLAIFGREGVRAAMRWVAPAVGSRVEDAFRLFLDYDGAGGAVTGTSTSCTSSDVDRVGAYAVESTTGEMVVLLFNKSTAEEGIHLTVAQPVTGTASLVQFTEASSLAPAGSVALSAGTVDLTLPARSATLLSLPNATSLIFTDDFEAGSTTAWSATVP
jgi:hypothetical protein